MATLSYPTSGRNFAQTLDATRVEVDMDGKFVRLKEDNDIADISVPNVRWKGINSNPKTDRRAMAIQNDIGGADGSNKCRFDGAGTLMSSR